MTKNLLIVILIKYSHFKKNIGTRVLIKFKGNRPNSSLLFSQGQFLLDNLVDCSKKLHFAVELSAPIKKRTQLSSIRREARARRSSDNGEYGMCSK